MFQYQMIAAIDLSNLLSLRPSEAVVFVATIIGAVLFILTDYSVRRIQRNRRRARMPLRLVNNGLEQWARVERPRDSFEGTGRARNARGVK